MANNYPKTRKSRGRHSEETKEKLRAAKLGALNPMFGKTGANHPFFGGKHTDVAKKKMSDARVGKYVGKNSPHWIEDRSKIAHLQDRNNPEYKAWRKAVLVRDGYCCRIDNVDCEGRVIAHHILPWSKFIELRFDVPNGITLCRFHHPKTRREEARLSPYFQHLVV